MGKFQSTYGGVVTNTEFVALKAVVESVYQASGRDDPLVGEVLRYLYETDAIKRIEDPDCLVAK